MRKSELRRWAKRRRAELDLESFTAAALPHLAALLEDRRRILLYAPLPGEADPRGLLNLLPKASFFLPRVAGRELIVLPYSERLRTSTLGVPEPIEGEPVPPGELDAVVVPALAYDSEGYRLGHGLGYYDRFLQRLRPNALSVGFLPRALVLDRLPRDPWDVPVKAIATEQGVLEPGIAGTEDTAL